MSSQLTRDELAQMRALLNLDTRSPTYEQDSTLLMDLLYVNAPDLISAAEDNLKMLGTITLKESAKIAAAREERISQLEKMLEVMKREANSAHERCMSLQGEYKTMCDLAATRAREGTELQMRIGELEAGLQLAETGCGNHGCKIRPPVGQGTNGPCRCIHTMRLALKIGGVK